MPRSLTVTQSLTEHLPQPGTVLGTGQGVQGSVRKDGPVVVSATGGLRAVEDRGGNRSRWAGARGEASWEVGPIGSRSESGRVGVKGAGAFQAGVRSPQTLPLCSPGPAFVREGSQGSPCPLHRL